MSFITTREQRRALERENSTKVIGVYAITQKSTGIVYVGSSVDIAHRWARHRTDLDCNRHHSIWLQRSWNKYGSADFVFSILEQLDSANGLRSKERCWISKFDQTFNSMIPSDSLGVIQHSEETRIKMSESQRRRFKTSPAKQISDKQKLQISAAHKGKIVSAESRAKMSASAKARSSSQAMRAKAFLSIGKRKYGPLSDQQKAKLSASHIGKPLSTSHKDRISAGLSKAYAEGRRNSLVLRDPLPFGWKKGSAA